MIYIISNLGKNSKKVKFEKDYYFKNIDDKYTPAIASKVMNESLNGTKEIFATLLDLGAKGYIEIDKGNTSFILKVCKKEKKEKLYLHEKYIINCINAQKKFNIPEFKKWVENDCEIEKLIKKKDKLTGEEKFFRLYLPLVSIIMSLIVFGFGGLIKFFFAIIAPDYLISITKLLEVLKKIDICMIIFTVIMFITSICFEETIKRLSKGEKYIKKLGGLKNYFRDYTLLKDRDYDYIKVTDRHLAYAIILEEADKIEDLYIKNNKLIEEYIEEENLGGNYEGTN